MFVTFNNPLFDRAVDAHRKGDLVAAERLYHEVLRQDPAHSQAQHALAVLAHQQGRSAQAAELLERLLQRTTATASMYTNLAEIRQALGELEQALAACDHALSIDPRFATAHLNRAAILQQQRQFTEALPSALCAADLAPSDAQPHALAGSILLQLDRPLEARPHLEFAARALPQDISILSALAATYDRLQRYDDAQACYETLVALTGQDPTTFMSMGTMLLRAQRFPAAKASFEKVLAIDPSHLAAREELASVLVDLRAFQHAIDLGRQILTQHPASITAYSALGEALMGLGEFQQAIDELRAPAALHASPALYQTLSNAYVRQGKPAEALVQLEHALALAPEDPRLHFNRSIILLLMGRLAEAWPEYEARWQLPRMPHRYRDLRGPAWDGAPLRGKPILLHAEQGLGDTILFGRYITLVRDRGGVPIVFCHDSLVQLVQTIPGVVEVVAANAPLPAFDVHLPLMSLPRIFQTTLDTIPARVPYIASPPEKKKQWKETLAHRARKLKVGLVWEGGPQTDNDLRSASLADFAPLADVPGVTFFALQKGPAARQSKTPPAGMHFIDLAPDIHDFSDTAAILDNLDLLISIDTSVIHVAGALAKPAWMLLAYSPGHMWMLNRPDSPWYPTVRLFRQPAFRDWKTPILEIKVQLQRWVIDGTPPA